MVCRVFVADSYTVKFFDGVVKTVKGIKIKPFRKEVRILSLSEPRRINSLTSVRVKYCTLSSAESTCIFVIYRTPASRGSRAANGLQEKTARPKRMEETIRMERLSQRKKTQKCQTVTSFRTACWLKRSRPKWQTDTKSKRINLPVLTWR